MRSPADIRNYLFISAWNDSGGGYTHRLLDGHPRFACWPFEIQLGTGLVSDGFSDWFRDKYRWPALPESFAARGARALFDAVIDDETKSVLVQGRAAKHGDFALDVSLDRWRDGFERAWNASDRTRAALVRCYIGSFFRELPPGGLSAAQDWFLGHCPTLNVDADRILHDLPEARILQVVRSPLTGFVDMRRRRPEVDVRAFGRKWSLITTLALTFQRKYPDRCTVVRFVDLLADPRAALDAVLGWCGLELLAAAPVPTWNGRSLSRDAMGPFGGVPRISAEHEADNLARLTAAERAVLAAHGDHVCDMFGVALY